MDFLSAKTGCRLRITKIGQESWHYLAIDEACPGVLEASQCANGAHLS